MIPKRGLGCAKAVAFALAITIASTVVTQPAHALTPDERFIVRVYLDFLQREPDEAELLWISATMSNGTSRASVVNGVLASNEFGELATYGVYLLYLGRSPDDAETASGSASITANDYFQLEVALLAGSEYFASAGGTNGSFVTRLFNSVLDRAPDTSGLAYWTGQLDTAARTRSQVVAAFIKGAEGAGLRVGGHSGLLNCPTIVIDSEISLYAGSYCIVLDRMASTTDVTFWRAQLQANGNELPNLFASLASSLEYYSTA